MKQRITFVGPVTSRTNMDFISIKDKYPQVASNELQLDYIKTLRLIQDAVVSVVSTIPASVYPSSPYRLLNANRLMEKEEGGIRYVSSINIPVIKQISLVLSLLLHLIPSCFFKTREKHVVLLYSVQFQFLFIGYILGLLPWISIVLIIPDIPQFTNFSVNKHSLKGWLKDINNRVMSRLLSGIDGFIVISKHIATDYLPKNKKKLVIDTIRSDEELDIHSIEDMSGRVLLYSGGLSDNYGLQLLINTVISLHKTDPRYELWITGKGQLEESISEFSRCNSAIKYWGHVGYSELKEIQNRANLLVSVKPTSQEYTKYTFPSKISEYMLSGRPVASTRILGIEDEYFDYIFEINDNNLEEMEESIKRVFALESKERMLRAEQAREYILRNKSPYAQANRIAKWIDELT